MFRRADRYYSDYYNSPDPVGRDGTAWTGRQAQEQPTDSVGPERLSWSLS
jgi:hypothetical protein